LDSERKSRSSVEAAYKEAEATAELERRDALIKTDQERRTAAADASATALLENRKTARNEARWIEAKALLDQAGKRATGGSEPIRRCVTDLQRDYNMVIALDEARFVAKEMRIGAAQVFDATRHRFQTGKPASHVAPMAAEDEIILGDHQRLLQTVFRA
jgi:hypothetical protein